MPRNQLETVWLFCFTCIFTVGLNTNLLSGNTPGSNLLIRLSVGSQKSTRGSFSANFIRRSGHWPTAPPCGESVLLQSLTEGAQMNPSTFPTYLWRFFSSYLFHTSCVLNTGWTKRRVSEGQWLKLQTATWCERVESENSFSIRTHHFCELIYVSQIW